MRGIPRFHLLLLDTRITMEENIHQGKTFWSRGAVCDHIWRSHEKCGWKDKSLFEIIMFSDGENDTEPRARPRSRSPLRIRGRSRTASPSRRSKGSRGSGTGAYHRSDLSEYTKTELLEELKRRMKY